MRTFTKKEIFDKIEEWIEAESVNGSYAISTIRLRNFLKKSFEEEFGENK